MHAQSFREPFLTSIHTETLTVENNQSEPTGKEKNSSEALRCLTIILTVQHRLF